MINISKPRYSSTVLNNLLPFFSCLFFCLSVFCAQESFAAEIVQVQNNASAKVTISNHDFTRIFIPGDRISNVKGVEGQYNLHKDSTSGDIYIAPTEKYQNKPFNVFLSTENGKNYQLTLLPKKVPAESVELFAPGNANPQAVAWEASSSYIQSISALMKDMYNDDTPDGYNYLRVSNAKPAPLGDIATVTLVQSYYGDHLKGNVYLVKNITKQDIRLSESQLYKNGSRAIALEDQVIPVGGETRLFMVVNK